MTEDSRVLTKQDLEELLRPTLDAEGAKIQDFSVRHLTKPGDNYGSTMLAVDVILTPGPRTLPLVAKMIPKSAALQELFQCEMTTRKEIDMYLLVRPAYDRIQKENGVPEDKYLDVLPVCYAARVSSKGDSAPVDDTSVILQENLKVQGYDCCDRFAGLGLGHCKLVVNKLARFHATAIAMKVRKPEEFKATVLRAAAPVKVKGLDPSITKPIEEMPEFASMKKRLSSALSASLTLYTSESPSPPREPFATLTHLDLWTNNIMFQEGAESPKDNPTNLKFVDFQFFTYDSPARDLLFFLYSSAHLEVLSEHYDYLVRFYHENFVDCLKILGCEASHYSFDEFLKEIEHASFVEFAHVAFMLTPIYTTTEDARSTDEMTHEDLKKPATIGKEYSDRARKLVSDFASRNWF